MSCSGGSRVGVVAGLAQKGSIRACLEIKVRQTPKGILAYGLADFFSKM